MDEATVKELAEVLEEVLDSGTYDLNGWFRSFIPEDEPLRRRAELAIEDFKFARAK